MIRVLWPWLAIAVGVTWRLTYSRRKHGLQLPPGPPPLPLLGNALDMPRTHLGREFAEMTQKYGESALTSPTAQILTEAVHVSDCCSGDIVYLNFLGQQMIVIGTHKVAHEILAKRSANYSDRPTSTMINLYSTFDCDVFLSLRYAARNRAGLSWISVLKEYGPEWRQHRRVLHQWFNSAVVGQYRPVQLKITRRFLRGLLKSPTNMVDQLKLYVSPRSDFRCIDVLVLIQGCSPQQHYLSHTASKWRKRTTSTSTWLSAYLKSERSSRFQGGTQWMQSLSYDSCRPGFRGQAFKSMPLMRNVRSPSSSISCSPRRGTQK